MLQILINAVLLLIELGICAAAIVWRVKGKRPVLNAILAIVAMLAFFITVGAITMPECHLVGISIVCPG
jgi:hypothetical protein